MATKLIAALIATTLTLSACSGSDDSAPASTSPQVTAQEFVKNLPEQFVGQVCLVVATKGYPASVTDAEERWGENQYGLDPQRILNETLTRCD